MSHTRLKRTFAVKALVAISAICVVVSSASVSLAQDRALNRDEWAKQQKQEELEKKFKELMTGCKFVGRYTVSENLNETPKADEYHIESATKVGDNKWMFVARIKYGSFDMKLPITLGVEWAGETPVIVVDEVEIGGGTYSARVAIHGKKYAASWDAGDHGGFMWGTIEKQDAADGEDAAKVDDGDGE